MGGTEGEREGEKEGVEGRLKGGAEEETKRGWAEFRWV